MSNTPTPHIQAVSGDFASTVLMPGDPRRSAMIASNYLTNARLVNDVRGVQGYTGLYKGKPVSVMASGMGIPSVSIYSYELFIFYNVQSIIRIGSAGTIQSDLPLRTVVAAMSTYTDSAFGTEFGFSGTLAPCASWSLLKAADDAAARLNIPLQVGPILTSDHFYDDSMSMMKLKKLGVKCVEMETYGLYLSAARTGKNALAMLTMTDNLLTNEHLSSEERETSLRQMIEIALEIA